MEYSRFNWSNNSPRELLLSIFPEALKAVSGEQCVSRYLTNHPIENPYYLIAIGKAATSMATGAVEQLGDKIEKGLVITKHGHATHLLHQERLKVIEAGHPLPDEQSLKAGDELLRFISSTPKNAQLLFLISGGASSLVEVLPDSLDIQQLRQINDWLLSSGLPIDVVNRIRKWISAIKAGRVAGYLGQRQVLGLMISDVPGDDPSVIGSGLLVSHNEDDLALELSQFPEWLQQLLVESPKLAEESAFRNIKNVVLATNQIARRAASEAAKSLDVAVEIHDFNFEGDAEQLGVDFARKVLEGPPGITIWGGESTVKLPERPGRGGRNQHMALAAALELTGYDNCFLLAAATDGSDGPTEDSGALVDGGTLERGRIEGMDAREYLQHADAGAFLEASGDLIQTGPTGTNVMDLVIGYKIDRQVE